MLLAAVKSNIHSECLVLEYTGVYLRGQDTEEKNQTWAPNLHTKVKNQYLHSEEGFIGIKVPQADGLKQQKFVLL